MITDLRLQNFRSYSDGSFEVSPGVNIIVGPNASGKTNLLEAVLVLARGASYRGRDQELVRFGQPWARLDSHNSRGGQRTVKIVADPLPSKSYEVDNKPYKRLNLKHTLPAVLFEPNHLRLFSGGPERRRDYLDDLLEQTTPGYGTTRRHYKRVLSQRNSLLKQPASVSAAQIFPWNVRLAQLAGIIARDRAELVNHLNADLPNLYQELSRTKTIVAAAYNHHLAADNYESQLLKKLDANLHEDQRRGFTGYGPHREDLTVLMDDHPAQETASRGEVRTAILALKIIELRIIEAARGLTPLLLLDDVFSELDGKRRHALTDYLAPYQTFITTTDADLVLQHFTESCNVIPLA